MLEAIAKKLTTDHALATGSDHGNRVMVTAGGKPGVHERRPRRRRSGRTSSFSPRRITLTTRWPSPSPIAGPCSCPPTRITELDVARPRRRDHAPHARHRDGVARQSHRRRLSAATLRAVNALCAARGIYHFHDEAYEAFTHDGAVHFTPATQPGAAAHTITFYSMSKAYGFASWRIGWMVYPAHLEGALRKIQDTLVICPPVISQFAAVGALAAGTPFVREQLRALTAVRAVVRRALAPLTAEGLAEIPPADGAFYFLPRLRTTRPPLEIAEKLIREHGVAVIPGSAFGVTQSCTIRVAYGALAETAAAGIDRLVTGLRAILRPAHWTGFRQPRTTCVFAAEPPKSSFNTLHKLSAGPHRAHRRPSRSARASVSFMAAVARRQEGKRVSRSFAVGARGDRPLPTASFRLVVRDEPHCAPAAPTTGDSRDRSHRGPQRSRP